MKVHLMLFERTGVALTRRGSLACGIGDLPSKQTTKDPREVTCTQCKKSKRFKAYEAGWDSCQDILRERVLYMLKLQEGGE